MEQSTHDFDVLKYVVQRIIVSLVSSEICARVKYGTIGFEFSIQDGVVVKSNSRVELSIRESTK